MKSNIGSISPNELGPNQALLKALESSHDMDSVVIVSINKSGEAQINISSMDITDFCYAKSCLDVFLSKIIGCQDED